MFHCLQNVIETKKNAEFFYLTLVTLAGRQGEGGQDGKWSHFPPLFFFEPFPNLAYKVGKAKQVTGYR